jgi:hypothetical protein
MLKDKQKIFAQEIVIGALLSAIGLLLVAYPIMRPASFLNDDQWGRIAASILTIGGTVFTTGGFRYLFWDRFETTQTKLASSSESVRALVDGVGASVRGAEKNLTTALADNSEMWQPRGFRRPRKPYGEYKNLYWRTKEGRESLWVGCEGLTWQDQIQPFALAQACIDHSKFNDQESVYVMFQLQRCLLVAATRIDDRNLLHPEMAGIFFFSTHNTKRDQLFGFLHHPNMDDEQSLSPCILSTAVIPEDKRDGLWLQGSGGGQVDINLPASTAPVIKVA